MLVNKFQVKKEMSITSSSKEAAVVVVVVVVVVLLVLPASALLKAKRVRQRAKAFMLDNLGLLFQNDLIHQVSPFLYSIF